MILKSFSVFCILFFICLTAPLVRGQASMQRGVRISNANGNIVTIQTGLAPQTYTLVLPLTSNPSLTSASVLYGLGSGNLNWTDATGVADGWILALKPSGPDLVPTWIDPTTFITNDWHLNGNTGTTAWNGTTGNILGTLDAQDLVIGTGATAATREKVRITQTGDLQLSQPGTKLSLLGTTTGSTTLQSGAQGANIYNLTLPITTPAVNEVLGVSAVSGASPYAVTLTWQSSSAGSYVNYNTGSSQNVASIASPNYLFNVAYSASATGSDALGAVISSASGTSGATDATGLSVISTANGAGTSTALYVTASGGSTQYAALFNGGRVGIGQTTPTQLLEVHDGNLLLSNSGSSSQLQFQGTSTGITTFESGAQGATNINYTLPISAAAANGYVLSSTTAGVMSWADPSTFGPSDWHLIGNSGTTAWNGATGNFIGTTDVQPLVVATTNTVTPQPIEFFTNTTEKMRLSATGNLGIGQTNPSQLLEVRNGNLLLSNSGSADQLQFQGTSTGITTFAAGAQGATNINYILPISAAAANGYVLSSTTAGVMSWAAAGTVTSVGLALPVSVFSVSGSPVTTSGTLTGAFSTQLANTVFAGPTNGAAAVPSFRSLVAADIPTLGYVTSVGLALPVSVFSVSGSPVTTSGTLTGAFTTQLANTVFAGPTNGAAAVPTFRSLVAADLPNLGTLAWLITGNSGTSAWNGATGNILGTLDAQDLVLGTGATAATREKIRITQAGNLQLSQPGTQLSFLGTSTGTTTLQAGAQGVNTYNLTLPITTPAANQVLAVSAISGASPYAVTLAWQNSTSGSFVNYNTPSVQNTAVITAANYLYNVAYTASATTNNALGAVISSSSGTSGNTSATGLAITSTANGTGTSTALNVTASGGSTQYAALFNGGKVGIGNAAPATGLDLSSDLATREYNYATSLSGTVNDVNFDAANNQTSLVRIATASAGFTLTGLVGGQNGKILHLRNASAQTMTIANQNASSVAANRIITGTGANMSIPSGGEVNLQYSATDSRWIVSSTNGVASTGSWLNVGNSGLVDNTTNLLGTLDNTSVRFIAGTTGTPNTRMLLDYSRGDLLLGANSGTASFSSAGGGRFAMGNALSTTRLNSIPTSSSRTFNIIDSGATLRLWRFNTLTSTNDPTIEFVGGTNDNQGNAANTWWDMYTTGTPYTTNTGTHSTGEHMAIRRRTGSVDSEFVSVFSSGNVGIGADGAGAAGTVSNAGTRLTVSNNDAATNTTTNIIALQHNSTGTPAANFGTGLLFRGKDSTTANQDMAGIKAIWTAANHASHVSALTFSTDSTGITTPTEKVRIQGNGYVGVNTTSANVRVDINGGYATRARTDTLTNGVNNDIYVGDCAFLRLVGPTAAFTMTGLTDGTDGKRLRIANMSGMDMTVADSSSLSAAGNRIETNTNSDITIKGPVPVLDMIYDGATGQWLLGTLNANQVIGGIGSLIYATKAANQTVTNSAVLQNDNDLFVPISAGQTWEFNGELDATNPANNIDIKIALTVPAGSTMKVMFTGIQDAGGNAIQGNSQLTVSGGSKQLAINAGTSTLIAMRGIVTAGANSGNIQLKWCQGVASAVNPTTLAAGSYVKIIRVK